ncbi:MAG: excinuclease ABC subunit UvrC [Ruminococcaceae bacterium]|nr:excinuclease ABC subunit UvrC [Oscillospiraceae bacterium]
MQENAEKIRELKEKALDLPQLPGVYIMRDKSGDIIYIGKAKKLKNRVVQYFRNIRSHLPKVYQMVIRVEDFDHILCDSEFEALVLECNLIKQHTPKYNILLKDDKGYHYIKLSSGDFPKISAAKQSDVSANRDGSKFIGPYMSAFAVKQMVQDVNKIFKLPTCNRSFPRDFGKKRPCLQHHLGLCSAVCTGKTSKEEYLSAFDDAVKYIKGNGAINLKELEKQMQKASEALDFELAARLRDRIRAAEKLSDEQKIFISNKIDCDFVALSAGERKCCICTLKYQKGRLVDSSQHIFDNQASFPEILSQFLVQFYSESKNIPREIAVNMHFEDRALVEKLLSEKSGRKVSITVPQKNEKQRLVLMAQSNAAEGLAALSQISGKEIAALDELMRLLSLPSVPEYIESYDISNLGDRHIVGGMVVFENGKPLKSAYRKFTIKDQVIQDDYSAMREMLRRRFTEYLNSSDHTQGFGRLPDLILLDGGKGHVSAVLPVLRELNIPVAVFGMVKDGKHRTRAITGEQEIVIASSRNAFTLVSKIQDEVHRYSISFQRAKHKKASLVLSLTQVEGIGKAKAAALFERFKTVKAMKEASLEELCSVKGITLTLANRLKEHLGK